MGWSSQYVDKDLPLTRYVKLLFRPELERKGYRVSVRRFGKEVWIQREDYPAGLAVYMLEKKGSEVFEKLIDYDMGPYTASEPPKSWVKTWAKARVKEYGLDEMPKLLNHWSPELVAAAAERLSKGG